jgi:hypothetical protein
MTHKQRMTHKTRKNSTHVNAKKGTQLKCRLKTCRSKTYQSVYGSGRGKSARSNMQLFY